MSLASSVSRLLRSLTTYPLCQHPTSVSVGGVTVMQRRNKVIHIELPERGRGRSFRRIIKYPEDGKYTVEPLDVIRMGGRDPKTGRVVVNRIGGGIKYKYTWIDPLHSRDPDGKPIKEKVMKIDMNIMCRTAKTALIASGEKKRWIIATENMKEGDILTNYSEIPRIPVRPKEGDCHPVGALPIGTIVCAVEPFPNHHIYYARAAGTSVQILRKVKDRVILQLPSKHEVSVDQWSMVRVGQVSNKEHSSIPIGSPNRSRWLGNRPGTGLWHRKTGYHGRKIRPLPPIRVMDSKATIKDMYCSLTSSKM